MSTTHAPIGAQSSKQSAHVDQLQCSLLNSRSSDVSTIGDDVLLSAYNSQVEMIRTLHIIGFARTKTAEAYGVGPQPREIPVIIDFLAPNLIRATGVLPFMSSRGFEMASDGREFRMLIPEKGRKEFLIGPIDAPAISLNSRENLRPQPLIDALRWIRASVGSAERTKSATAGPTRTIAVDFLPERSGPIKGAIAFDRGSGIVDSLSTYALAGELISQTTYSDWKKMSIYPEGTPIGCFPRRIHLVQPEAKIDLEIRITEIALNPELSRSIFHPSPPRGIQVFHVDRTGASSYKP